MSAPRTAVPCGADTTRGFRVQARSRSPRNVTKMFGTCFPQAVDAGVAAACRLPQLQMMKRSPDASNTCALFTIKLYDVLVNERTRIAAPREHWESMLGKSEAASEWTVKRR
ncbi:hypothetical protein NDU88_004806 [Pleurodeles waltl]|uniref:Uncharacterized protein n=1 Tax=Pleurodeles waltl TaxID=8319 RepID=A0AAV7SJZ8_PLEWA|nr:hypothetical protein NDU88_004806 [Pleurodeles waltl]